MPSSHPYKTVKSLFENRPELELVTPYSLLVDQNVSIPLQTNRPASQILVTNLPPGIDLNASGWKLSGTPTTTGTYISSFETSNAAGSLAKQISLILRTFVHGFMVLRLIFPDLPKILKLRISRSMWN